MAESLTHKAIIGRILQRYPDARTYGFLDSIRFEVVRFCEEFQESLEDTALPDIRPDAFVIEREVAYGTTFSRITAFEVVVTHPLKQKKLEAYDYLWWVLDNWSIDFRVVRVSPELECTEIPFSTRYLRRIVEESGRPLPQELLFDAPEGGRP